MDAKTHHRWWRERGSAYVNRVLHDDWNPIGFGVPDDEYSTYADTIERLLYEGHGAEEVASFLAEARGHMGLASDDSDDQTDLRVARQLVAWFKEEDTAS